jgi:hypothetical protein
MSDDFKALTEHIGVIDELHPPEIWFHDPTDGLPVRGTVPSNAAIDVAARTIDVNCANIARFKGNKQPVTFVFDKPPEAPVPVPEPAFDTEKTT